MEAELVHSPSFQQSKGGSGYLLGLDQETVNINGKNTVDAVHNTQLPINGRGKKGDSAEYV